MKLQRALWAACATLAAAPILAADYDPIPKAWTTRIDRPGWLSVGAEYCTQSGKCRWVGDDMAGATIGGQAVSGLQACQQLPDAAPCVQARLPVHVLAASPAGVVIVRLAGKNYAVSGTDWYKKLPDGSTIGGPVVVVDGATSLPLQLWMEGRLH